MYFLMHTIRRPPLSASRRWTRTLPAFNDKTQRHLLLPFPRLGPNPYPFLCFSLSPWPRTITDDDGDVQLLSGLLFQDFEEASS